MEHRQRVQQRVAVGDRRVPPEAHRVQVTIAVRELHALRSCRGAGRVVDAAGRVLVPLPGGRVPTLFDGSEDPRVADAIENDPLLDVHAGEGGIDLRVDE